MSLRLSFCWQTTKWFECPQTSWNFTLLLVLLVSLIGPGSENKARGQFPVDHRSRSTSTKNQKLRLEPICTASSESAQNLILITLDGLRQEELFGGADVRLMTKESGGVRDLPSLRSRFWREDRIERRKVLLPFFWNVMARQGQLIGDPELESKVICENGKYFSYPGYNELLSGKPDPRIASNDKKPNPNETVLEWIGKQKGFKNRVAAFGSWDVFPYIINEKRSGIPVNAGWMPLQVGDTERIKELNLFANELPRVWHNVRYDLFTFEGAAEYLRSQKPRLLYVAFGETDDWAHDGRYDLYLDSAHRTDQYIRQLWELVQSLPDYRGKTAILISTDHGRGGGREGWKNHSAQLKGSERIWIAAMGNGVAPLGNRKSLDASQSQFAASAASLLGLQFEGEGIAPAIEFSQPR